MMLNENEYLATVPFDLYELSLFHLVATHRSFTRAGQLAGLTQSAITRQIRAMETSLGVALFEQSASASPAPSAWPACRVSSSPTRENSPPSRFRWSTSRAGRFWTPSKRRRSTLDFSHHRAGLPKLFRSPIVSPTISLLSCRPISGSLPASIKPPRTGSGDFWQNSVAC